MIYIAGVHYPIWLVCPVFANLWIYVWVGKCMRFLKPSHSHKMRKYKKVQLTLWKETFAAWITVFFFKWIVQAGSSFCYISFISNSILWLLRLSVCFSVKHHKPAHRTGIWCYIFAVLLLCCWQVHFMPEIIWQVINITIHIKGTVNICDKFWFPLSWYGVSTLKENRILRRTATFVVLSSLKH